MPKKNAFESRQLQSIERTIVHSKNNAPKERLHEEEGGDFTTLHLGNPSPRDSILSLKYSISHSN